MKLIFIPLFFCLTLAIRFSELASDISAKSANDNKDLMAWYDAHKTRSVVYRDSLEIDRAIEVLDSCIKFAPREPKTASEHEKLGWIYVNRAYLYESYSGNFHEAKKNYLLALKSFHNAKTENFLVARYLYQPLGNIHTRFGENEQAIRYLEQFIQIADSNNQSSAALNGLNDLGRAYMNKGDYAKSEEILLSGISKSKKDFYNKGLLYSSLAEVYSDSGRLNQGIEASQESLKAFEIAKKSIPTDDFRYDQITRYKIGVLTTLGGLYTKTNNFLGSEEILETSGKLATDLYPNRHRKIAKIYLAKGANSLATKKFKRALSEYHQALISSSLAFQNKNPLALPETNRLTSEVSQGEALLWKARVLIQMDGSQEYSILALKHYQKYFEWINLSIQEQQDTYSKLVFVEEIHAVANEAIELVYQLRDAIPEDSAAQIAYSFIDQSKGILLSQSQQTRKFSKTEDDPAFKLLRELSMQLVKFQRELKDVVMKQDHSRIAALKKEIAHLDQEKQLVGFKIAQRYPKLQSSWIRYDQEKILHQLDQLQPNECLINYFEGERYYYSVIVENGRFHLYRLHPTTDQEILHLLPVFREHAVVSPREYEEIAHKLYSHLCPGIVRTSKLFHWIVVPDGQLHSLPLEALTYSNSRKNNWKNLNYLVHRKVISYAPTTASVFTKRKALNKTTFSGFAPVFEQSTVFPELTFSAKEIEAAKEGFEGSIYLKKKATKNALAHALKKHTIVHVSTHAGADTTNLTDSWIALHGGTKVLSSDLLNMEVNAELVVLNACETGTGKYAVGEGVISLARSFLSSGSNCVITNLYQANHGVNADVFKRFYRHLKTVKSPARAMQKAKIEFFNDQNTDSQSAHPRNWATPVVMGNASKIQMEGIAASNTSLLWWLSSLIILIGFLGIRYYKIKKTSNKPLI